MHSIQTVKELSGLAAYLVHDGLLESNNAQAAMKMAAEQGVSLTSYLVKTNLLLGQQIVDCCAKYFSLPIFDLKKFTAHDINHALIPSELIYRYRVIPLKRDHLCLYLGITDPTDHDSLAAIRFHTELRVQPLLMREEELEQLIQQHYHPKRLESQLESTLAKLSPLEHVITVPENAAKEDEPVIEFVDSLIEDACEKNISDIHIEPYEKCCRIRFRHDGLLQDAASLPPHLAERIITRLKIMAQLNIAERRLPQDGRMRLLQNNQRKSNIEIRISTCPTLFGEKIVLRLLDKKSSALDINKLGLTDAQKELLISTLHQPQGLILVTGPTGSGKTLTLYAALQYLNQIEKNISSVEDPIEMELHGINQVNINPRIGLDFATVLRSFLRQDPDILMVGEIRDSDTAHTAMQAAETGHLVLSTLHTNSANETMKRLRALGVMTYHLMNSVSLIIAQRLLRKLCDHCKQPEILAHPQHLPRLRAYRANGCKLCHQGYQGRIGIFECLPKAEFKTKSYLSLWEAGMTKVSAGITSYAELKRVVAP